MGQTSASDVTRHGRLSRADRIVEAPKRDLVAASSGRARRTRLYAAARDRIRLPSESKPMFFCPRHRLSVVQSVSHLAPAVATIVTGQLADTPTRGLPTRGLDKSRTGQLAVSQMPPNRKTKHGKSPMASASFPVRDLSITRVV